MYRRKQFVLAAAISFAATVISSSPAALHQSPEPALTRERPIIKVDLHKFADPYWNPNNSGEQGSTIGSAIHFVNGISVVWSWLTRDDALPRTKDSSRSPVSLPPQATHVHAVLLDALTGRAKTKRDWSAPSKEVYYSVVQNGNFITCVDNNIRLYSAEFELLQEMHLESPFQCMRLAALASGGISPSGRSILAATVSGDKNISEVLDTGTLKPISTANEGKPVTITALSDHWLAGHCGSPWEVCIRNIAGSWKPFSFSGAENQPPTRVLGRAYFVNDDTILICRLHDLVMANVNGSVLFRVNLPKDRSCDNNRPTPSNDGRRFAIMESKRLPINEFFEMGLPWTDDKILVFDTSERRAIFAVKVDGAAQWPSTRTHSHEFALSPDGDRLAVVSDGILKIYKLPAD